MVKKQSKTEKFTNSLTKSLKNLEDATKRVMESLGNADKEMQKKMEAVTDKALGKSKKK